MCAVLGFCRLRPSQLLDKIQNRATPLAKEVTPFASSRNCQPNRLQAFVAKAIDGKHCAGLWRHRLDQHRQPLGAGSEHSAEKTIGYRGRLFRLMACHRDSSPFLPRLLASQWLIFGGACRNLFLIFSYYALEAVFNERQGSSTRFFVPTNAARLRSLSSERARFILYLPSNETRPWQINPV